MKALDRRVRRLERTFAWKQPAAPWRGRRGRVWGSCVLPYCDVQLVSQSEWLPISIDNARSELLLQPITSSLGKVGT